MGFVGWPLGLFLSAVSSVFGILGKLFLKLAHNQRERDRDEHVRQQQQLSSPPPLTRSAAHSKLWCIYFYSGLVSMLVLNPALAAAAYGFASQSLLAPMAGLTIGWNTLLGPILLPHERLSTHDFVGALLIFTGCVLVGVSGTHDTPPMPVTTVAARFVTVPFLLYMVALAVTVCMLVFYAREALLITWRRHASPTQRTLRPIARISISVLSGVTSGQLFFLAAAMRLAHEGRAGHIWSYPVTYLCIVGALGTAVGGLYLLNAALKVEDAVVVIYLYEASYILSGALSGLCFFQDMNELSTWHYVVYALSLTLILLGIYVVAHRDTSRLDADDENLLPLLSAPATMNDVTAAHLFGESSYIASRRSSSPMRKYEGRSSDAHRSRRKSFPLAMPEVA